MSVEIQENEYVVESPDPDHWTAADVIEGEQVIVPLRKPWRGGLHLDPDCRVVKGMDGAQWRNANTFPLEHSEFCGVCGPGATRSRYEMEEPDYDIEDGNPHQRADVLTYYYWVENWTCPEIAERFDVSSSTIARWLKKHDIKETPPEQ